MLASVMRKAWHAEAEHGTAASAQARPERRSLASNHFPEGRSFSFFVGEGLGEGEGEGDGLGAGERGGVPAVVGRAPLRVGDGDGLGLRDATGLAERSGDGAGCATGCGAGRGVGEVCDSGADRTSTACPPCAAARGTSTSTGERVALADGAGTCGPRGCTTPGWSIAIGRSIGVIGVTVVTPTAVPSPTAPTPAAVELATDAAVPASEGAVPMMGS